MESFEGSSSIRTEAAGRAMTDARSKAVKSEQRNLFPQLGP
jgi:hypothetical protein